MTVYVTQDTFVRLPDGTQQRKFDLSTAEQYGDVKVLLNGSQSVVSTVPVVRQLLEQLRTFNDDDYLLMIGDPSVMAMVSMIAYKYNGGRAKLLKWDRRQNKYLPIQIDVSGKQL